MSTIDYFIEISRMRIAHITEKTTFMVNVEHLFFHIYKLPLCIQTYTFKDIYKTHRTIFFLKYDCTYMNVYVHKKHVFTFSNYCKH
jgi:hypothetical protein